MKYGSAGDVLFGWIKLYNVCRTEISFMRTALLLMNRISHQVVQNTVVDAKVLMMRFSWL